MIYIICWIVSGQLHLLYRHDLLAQVLKERKEKNPEHYPLAKFLFFFTAGILGPLPILMDLVFLLGRPRQ